MPLVALKCPSCGAEMTVDDSQTSIFCQYCGTKIEIIPERIEVNQNVNIRVDHSNEPNLIINYSSVHPKVLLVARIASTGQKAVYMNGQTASYHLPAGKQVIVLKIGKKNYKRVVYITPQNGPVIINCSYVGRAQIMIDQPPYEIGGVQVSGGGNAPVAQGPKMSGMAIAAFVLSLTVCGGPIGLILGIIDLIISKKDRRHGLAVAAIVIGSLFTIGLISFLVNRT